MLGLMNNVWLNLLLENTNLLANYKKLWLAYKLSLNNINYKVIWVVTLIDLIKQLKIINAYILKYKMTPIITI